MVFLEDLFRLFRLEGLEVPEDLEDLLHLECLEDQYHLFRPEDLLHLECLEYLEGLEDQYRLFLLLVLWLLARPKDLLDQFHQLDLEYLEVLVLPIIP